MDTGLAVTDDARGGADGKKAFARDRRLNHWLRATGEPLKILVASIVATVRKHEQASIEQLNAAEKVAAELESRKARLKRRRRPEDQRSLRDAIELVVCNLAHGPLTDGDKRPIAYSRRKADKPTRYDNSLVLTDSFRAGVDLLSSVGILEGNLGTVNERQSTFRSTERFRRDLALSGASCDDIGLSDTEETIILKSRLAGFDTDGNAKFGGRGQRLPYADTDTTRLMRAQMTDINAFIFASDIAFAGDGDGQVNVAERRLRRYFTLAEHTVARFDLGGRLFGGWWQNLKRERRAHIRIDGEPCSELDYGSMFPRLAYAHRGVSAPTDDIYDLKPHWPAFDVSVHRKATKIAFNSLFYGRERFDAELKTGLPKNVTAGKFRKAVAAKHPALEPLLGSTVGHQLMMQESNILIGVLRSLRERGIVALPIHDAILVRQSEGGEALKVMQEVAERCCGYSIPVSQSLAGHK